MMGAARRRLVLSAGEATAGVTGTSVSQAVGGRAGAAARRRRPSRRYGAAVTSGGPDPGRPPSTDLETSSHTASQHGSPSRPLVRCGRRTCKTYLPIMSENREANKTSMGVGEDIPI